MFCESIDGGELVSDPEAVSGIFGGATWIVSQFNCYQGVDVSVIESNTGVCLTSVNQILIDEYYNNQSSGASTIVLCISTFILSLLVLF